MTDLLNQPGQTVDPRDLRAQEAVRIFRSMQSGLTGYACAVTGKKVSVELATGTPRTDGKKIYLKPPIELGDKYTHKRNICDKRDPVTGTLLCFACKAREEVMVGLYHEIGHIAGGTFESPSMADQVTAVNNSIEAYGSKYAAKIKTKIERAPSWTKGDFLNLSSHVSPFLPIIVNSLEDTRVDNQMFKARKGTKIMFDAWVYRTFADGVEQPDGSHKMWSEYPLNSQAMVGLFVVSCGYKFSGWFAPEVEEALGDEKLNALIARMDTVRSVRGVYQLAFPILARLKELGFCREPHDDFEPEDEDEEPAESDEDSSSDSNMEESSDEAGSDSGEADAESSGEDEDNLSEDEGSAGNSDSEGSDAGDQSGMADEADDEGSVDDSESSPDSEDPGDSGDGGTSAGEDDADGEGSDVSGSKSDGGADNQPGESDGDGDDSDQSDSELPGSGMDEVSKREDSDDGEELSEESGESEPSEPGGSSSGSPGGSTDGESEGGVLDESDNDEISSDSDGEPDGFEPTESGDGDDQPSGSADQSQTPEDSDDWLDSGSSDEGDAGEGEGPTDSDASGQPGGGKPVDSDEGVEPDGSQLSEDESVNGSPDVLGSPTDTDAPESPQQSDPSGAEGVEPIDTGADEGMGGTQSDQEYGTADDVGEIVKVFGHHDKVIPQPETHDDELNDKALDAAIVQGLYFEKPSTFVRGVRIHKYGHPIVEEGSNQSVGWPRITNDDAARRRGVIADTQVDEVILGQALMETRRTFADNARRGHEHNLKSGRVNRKVLGRRAPTGDPRLFSKTRLPKTKSYAVGIGIDISGSTYGLNLALAKRAAMAQAELCHRVGIPFAVWAHTAQYPKGKMTMSNGLTLDIYEVKGFNESWDVNAIEALANLGSAHENLDGHGIEFYRRQLERMDATDHILMYYTDGKMPAANYREELEVLQHEIRVFKQKRMTLMGVGIRTDSPRRHGLDTVQVDSDEDLVKVVRHLEKKLVHTAR